MLKVAWKNKPLKEKHKTWKYICSRKKTFKHVKVDCYDLSSVLSCTRHMVDVVNIPKINGNHIASATPNHPTPQQPVHNKQIHWKFAREWIYVFLCQTTSPILMILHVQHVTRITADKSCSTVLGILKIVWPSFNMSRYFEIGKLPSL